ncbi:MAG: tetratricopeptide repeat protein [Bacteroidota bacterium]|nr:tetratricopeptide repeat protein [Bacteroidota bacterium]
MKTYLNKILCLFLCLIVLCACKEKEQKATETQQDRQTQIENYAQSLMAEPMILDKQKADTLINLYNRYIADFPDDTMNAYYLYRMSNIYANLQNCNKTIDCLNRIIQKYPNSNYVGAARFFKGVFYKDVCDNVEKSKEAFEEYIAKHPNSPRVEDAKKLMQIDTMQNPTDILK